MKVEIGLDLLEDTLMISILGCLNLLKIAVNSLMVFFQ